MQRFFRKVGARSFVVTLAIGIATVGPLGPARADGGEPGGPGGTGGGAIGVPGTAPTQTPAAAAQGDAKLQLAQTYAQYRAGRVSASDYATAESAYRAAYGAAALAGTPAAKPDAVAATATSRTLSVVQHDQATSYYCGPATAESIVEYLTSATHASRYDGTSLSQAHLAGGNYLQTTSTAGTPWTSGRMPIALNRWSEGTTSGFYFNLAAPNSSSFKSALTFDIDHFHPFANSTLESANSPKHYNKHPQDRQIGHWVPARGYSTSGARAAFADPAHSSKVSWGHLPAEYFTLDSGAWAAYYLSAHGIVW